jgi:hypothetical protein
MCATLEPFLQVTRMPLVCGTALMWGAGTAWPNGVAANLAAVERFVTRERSPQSDE